MRTGKVQASLRISVVSLEPILFTHVNGRPKETSAKGNQPKENFSQRKTEEPFSRDTAHILSPRGYFPWFVVRGA